MSWKAAVLIILGGFVILGVGNVVQGFRHS